MAVAGSKSAKVTLPSETEVLITREFDARKHLVYEGMPEAEAVDTLTLTEVAGRTTLEILVQHQSKEHRDAHINSGMEDGLQDALDLLEQVAVSLR